MVCKYYQAQVEQSKCWFLVAVLRSFEHMAFDRTLDTATSTFEFFVPSAQEQIFLELMAYFSQQDIVRDLRQCENRLSDPHQTV